MDAVFKALADPTRRALLDGLNRRNGQTLRELCAELDMTRQAVTKHLAVLEGAGLVVTVRRGREKLHHLNVAPINDIAERWIDRYDRGRVTALANLKVALEGTMSATSFVYVTYIKTTAEKLYRALTEPEFIRQYFEGGGPSSDWRVGSPINWKMEADGESYDWGQRVLEAEPGKRLSYTWHNYEPPMAKFYPDWTDERLAELRKEPVSKVTFDIEPAGDGVKLTVVHDGFAPGSAMLEGIGQGWPGILSNLKTVLETGSAAAFG